MVNKDCHYYFNHYPGNWGVKKNPVHFCICISKTVRDTGMRFCDIVPDSDGYLSHINFCRIAAGNVNMAVLKPEVHLRKSAKSMPDSIVSDYNQGPICNTAPRNMRYNENCDL